MTNEEKSKDIANKHTYVSDDIEYSDVVAACQEMAEWKDQQFKVYLKHKINGLTNIIYKTNSMVTIKRCDEMIYVFTKIINELFKEK